MESQPMRNQKLIQIPAIKEGKYPTRFCRVFQNIISVLHPLYRVPLHGIKPSKSATNNVKL
jgi:hypothetical protein